MSGELCSDFSIDAGIKITVLTLGKHGAYYAFPFMSLAAASKLASEIENIYSIRYGRTIITQATGEVQGKQRGTGDVEGYKNDCFIICDNGRIHARFSSQLLSQVNLYIPELRGPYYCVEKE